MTRDCQFCPGRQRDNTVRSVFINFQFFFFSFFFALEINDLQIAASRFRNAARKVKERCFWSRAAINNRYAEYAKNTQLPNSVCEERASGDHNTLLSRQPARMRHVIFSSHDPDTCRPFVAVCGSDHVVLVKPHSAFPSSPM